MLLFMTQAAMELDSRGLLALLLLSLLLGSKDGKMVMEADGHDGCIGLWSFDGFPCFLTNPAM